MNTDDERLMERLRRDLDGWNTIAHADLPTPEYQLSSERIIGLKERLKASADLGQYVCSYIGVRSMLRGEKHLMGPPTTRESFAYQASLIATEAIVHLDAAIHLPGDQWLPYFVGPDVIDEALEEMGSLPDWKRAAESGALDG